MRFSLAPALLVPALLAFAGAALSAPIASTGAQAAACGPGKLGTHRTMKVPTKRFREIIGDEKRFGLKRGEVVLTFDDGPIAGRTNRVLDALKVHCTKATFFSVGRMARAYPRLTKRIVREGHTLAHHTQGHQRMTAYGPTKRGQYIDRGIAMVERIAYGRKKGEPVRVPFFRYPYLARSRATDVQLRKRGLIAFGANIDSRDWKKVSPATVHNRVMKRLRREGKGIILLHDIQMRTAKMLPRLLKSLKAEGYRVVHIVPAGRGKPAPVVAEEPLLVAKAKPVETPKPVEEPVVVASVKPAAPEPVVKKAEPAPTIARTRTDAVVAEALSVASLSPSDVDRRENQLSSRAPAMQPLVSVAGDPQRPSVPSVTERTATPPPAPSPTATAPKPTKIKKTVKRKTKKKPRKVVAKRKRKTRGTVQSANAKLRLRRSQWILR